MRARERRRLGMPVEACVLEDLVVVVVVVVEIFWVKTCSGAEQVFLSPLSLFNSTYPCVLACFGRMMMGLQAQQTVAKQNASDAGGARLAAPPQAFGRFQRRRIHILFVRSLQETLERSREDAQVLFTIYKF
jgi:hypothetical protein